MLALGPSLVDRCLMFEKGKMSLVVEFFRWFSWDDFNKKSTHPLRAIDAQRMSYTISKNDVKKPKIPLVEILPARSSHSV